MVWLTHSVEPSDWDWEWGASAVTTSAVVTIVVTVTGTVTSSFAPSNESLVSLVQLLLCVLLVQSLTL